MIKKVWDWTVRVVGVVVRLAGFAVGLVMIYVILQIIFLKVIPELTPRTRLGGIYRTTVPVFGPVDLADREAFLKAQKYDPDGVTEMFLSGRVVQLNPDLDEEVRVIDHDGEGWRLGKKWVRVRSGGKTLWITEDWLK